MSGILVIGAEQQKQIDDAIARARAKPTPWGALEPDAVNDETNTLSLAERYEPDRVERVRREYPSQRVVLGTYEAAFSFEHQPAGLLRHLSVASARSDKVPGPPVMEMVCRAFGFDETLCKSMGNPNSNLHPARPARVWIEEFMPGHHAINVVELVEDDDGMFAVSEALRTDPDAAP